MQEVAGEDCIAVPPRRDGLEAAGGRFTRSLIGDGQLPAAHGVEEEHAGDERVPSLSAFHVLIEVEVDGHSGRVRTADPPFRAGAAAGAGQRPQRQHGVLDGVGGTRASRQPEGGEVALAQALASEPRDGGAGAADQRLGQRRIDHAHERL
jgi:hypothetical protein